MKYDIIHLDGFTYAYSTDHAEKDDYYYNPVTQTINQAISGKINTNKVVATNDPSLGLPLLPDKVSNCCGEEGTRNLTNTELSYEEAEMCPRCLEHCEYVNIEY